MTSRGDRLTVHLAKARRSDAQALTEVAVRSFDDDARRHAGLPRGGPPGYDLVEWHQWAMGRGIYYKILAGDTIVGGIILFDLHHGHFNLGCFFIDPDCQGQGIGTAAVAFVEAAHPHVKKWTLDTPAWSPRNHHFYEKLGYVRTGQEWDSDGVRLWMYEKVVTPGS